MQYECWQQNYFILSSCVLCQFSCPTSQQQRTPPVIMRQAASRTVFTSSKHYLPAAGGLNAASVAELILLHWCVSDIFSIYLRNLLCPGAHSCLSLSAQNLFYVSGLPDANASFLQKNTQYSFQQTKCFYPSIFLINSVCLTCFLQVQYASLYAGSVNHTRQMWKLQVWTAGLTSNFQGFFVCRCSDISMQA